MQAPGDGRPWVRRLVPQLADAMPAAPSRTTPELRAAYNAVCAAAWGDRHLVSASMTLTMPVHNTACVAIEAGAVASHATAEHSVILQRRIRPIVSRLHCVETVVPSRKTANVTTVAQVTRNYLLPAVRDDGEVRASSDELRVTVQQFVHAAQPLPGS